MKRPVKYSLIIGGLGALFFLPFLGGVHLFDWDEVNFAEIAREMVVLDDYLRIHVNFKPFWEKPPFFFWLQAAAMHLVGINEYAARLPNAICGIITLVLLYHIGRKLYHHRMGVIWAGVYLGTVLPHLYFKSAIIDPVFNLFIFLGLYYVILFYWKKDDFPAIRLPKKLYTYLLLGGFFTGMAILTKGPVAFLIVCLTLGVYWIIKRFRFFIKPHQFIIFTIASSIVMLLWYGLETWAHGSWFVHEFTKYQIRLFSTPDAGHKGFLGYHFVVLLVGCFPASIFCARSFFKVEQQFDYQRDFRLWMIILFWVVLILFTIVESKIVHYSSMCYFPLTFLAALVINQIIEQKIKLSGWMKYGLLFIAALYGIAVIATPFIGMNAEILKPLFNDPFAQASLNAEVNWTGWEAFPGFLIITLTLLSIYYLNRNKTKLGFGTLFGGTALFVFLTLVFFIAKIERYSQHAAIEFFQGLQDKDCYATTFGYKSYAQLFYTQKQPPENRKSLNDHWLLHGDIDKDVYIVTKIHKTNELNNEVAGLEKLGGRNGFVFFVRKAQP